MTELDRSERGASFAKSGSGDRPLLVGGLVAALTSAAGSLFAYGTLPTEMQIHWTLGAGPYYGPEFAPTVLVMAAVQVVVVAVACAGYWGAKRLEARSKDAVVQQFYTLVVLGTLAVVVALQGVLVAANL
jgi:hypothetical protein